jgi:anti-anti-sigma factor
MDIKIKRSKNGVSSIALSGDISVDNSGELKDLLLKEALKHNSIAIDVSSITDVDVAGMQILCAIHKYMNNSGKDITLKGMTDTFSSIISRSGFTHNKGCAKELEPCLWSEEKEG